MLVIGALEAGQIRIFHVLDRAKSITVSGQYLFQAQNDLPAIENRPENRR